MKTQQGKLVLFFDVLEFAAWLDFGHQSNPRMAEHPGCLSRISLLLPLFRMRHGDRQPGAKKVCH
jgi:hypothetical protein